MPSGGRQLVRMPTFVHGRAKKLSDRPEHVPALATARFHPSEAPLSRAVRSRQVERSTRAKAHSKTTASPPANGAPFRQDLIRPLPSSCRRDSARSAFRTGCRSPAQGEFNGAAGRSPILVIVLIRIEANDLPGRSCGPSPERPGGHHGIEVGVQRNNHPDELMGRVSADVDSVAWEIEANPVSAAATDFRGAYISGPPGGRFIYLSWGVVEGPTNFEMFRRAKIMLDAVPPDVMRTSVESGVLVGRLGLTDPKGNPICAAIRPPLIRWTSATE